MPNTSWINNTLFSWFDSSNATHNVLLGAIGSILATIITTSVAWTILRTWGHARSIIVDESRKTHRYLKSLERLARLTLYWKSASFAQRSQFLVLRLTLILCAAATALACQGILTFGSVISTMQEDTPKNIIEVINASKDASKHIGSVGVAFIQQQYIMPAAWTLCALTITIMLLALSAIVYMFKTIRLAEIADFEELMQAINSIRLSLDLPEISEKSETLKVSHSLLYPE